MKFLNENIVYSEHNKKFFIEDLDVINYPFGRSIPEGHSWLICLNNGDIKIVETSWKGKLNSPDNKFDFTEYIASVDIHKIITLEN